MDPKWVHQSDLDFESRPSNLRFSDDSPNTFEDIEDTEIMRLLTISFAQSFVISTSTRVGPMSSGRVKGDKSLRRGAIPYAIDSIP